MKPSSMTETEMGNYRTWRAIGRPFKEAIELAKVRPPNLNDVDFTDEPDWTTRLLRSIRNREIYESTSGPLPRVSARKQRIRQMIQERFEKTTGMNQPLPGVVETSFGESLDFTIPQNAPLDLQQIHGMQDQFGAPIESVTTDLKTFFKYSQLDWGVDPAADVETGEIEQ